jgi:hypothetical protein
MELLYEVRSRTFLLLFALFFTTVLFVVGTHAAEDMDALGSEEGDLRTRTVYINGWMLDTRLHSSIDIDPNAPSKWARRNKRDIPADPSLAEDDDQLASVVALVHVRPLMSAKKVQEIEAYLGASLGDYKSNNTFVLTASPDVVRRAVTAPHVVWVRARSWPGLSLSLSLLQSLS